MTVPQKPPSPENEVHLRFVDKARLASLTVLSALLVLCLVFSWITRGNMSNLPFLASQGRNAAAKSLVDLRPWLTAQTLAALAVTTEEKGYARDAERLADHEVDQAFATALRQANLRAEHRTLTTDTLPLAQRVQQLQQTVAQDKSEVQRLTALAKEQGSAGSESDESDDDLAIAKAQLGLDTDQLNDAQDDLNRATGDTRTQIQTELAAHEAAMTKYDNEVKNGDEIAVIAVARQGTLARRLTSWFSQRTRAQLIQQAIQETRNDLARLNSEHDELETKANATRPEFVFESQRASYLADLKDRTLERQILSIYDDRIQTEQQLVRVYERWAAQLERQHGIVLHLILRSTAIILFILICMILGAALVHRFMSALAASQRRMRTLRSVLELSIQVIGGLLILLVIFGWPQQMPTILGLVTAGITIVLQDFILAFFGWFVLMGKNGMRVGDRVEINGVGGEVTEIGLINTTLLEIGSHADTGLPTGRRISFINSFAIRGQYFNYSTAGQWLWDEITINLPASANPRPILNRVQEVVQEETRESAAIALQEWKRSMHSRNLSRLDTTPVVNLVTTAAGYDIQIRYVSRASTRFDTRIALYRRLFDSVQEARFPEQAAQEPGAAKS
jgi:small-conductance mechanosensitive channel